MTITTMIFGVYNTTISYVFSTGRTDTSYINITVHLSSDIVNFYFFYFDSQSYPDLYRTLAVYYP